jgi:hypothetical protein
LAADDAFQAGLYGKTYYGPGYIGAALAYTEHWIKTDRFVFAGDELTASFEAQSYGGRLESGYRYAVAPAFGVTPYGAVQTQWFHTPAYSEADPTGGGFGLSYNSMTANDTRSELGARFDEASLLGTMPLVLRGRVAWAQRLGRKSGVERGVPNAAGRQLHRQRRGCAEELGARLCRRRTAPHYHPELDRDCEIRRRVRGAIADLRRHRHAAIYRGERPARSPFCRGAPVRSCAGFQPPATTVSPRAPATGG